MPDFLPCDSSPALQASQAAQVSAENAAEVLRISELQYRRLFEAARDGILLLDSSQGKITDANPFMTELLGYSHDELIGKELWEIGLLEDKDAGQEAFRCLKQDGYIRYENLPLLNQQGEQREVEFVSNLYRENGHSVIQCNIRDITERKRVEADLIAAAAKHGRQAAALEERTHLAQEIHDTLAQGFAGVITQLEAADAALASVPNAIIPADFANYQRQVEKIRTRIGKVRDLARASLAEARRSVATLRSMPLETAPLVDTLAYFLAQRVLGSQIKSRYVLEGIPFALPAVTDHCLLRVGQEAIANTVEHAQAQEIVVELLFEREQVRLRVYDDGQGFDPSILSAGRYGLIGMRERVSLAKGQITIVSHLGKGTKIDISVPAFQEAVP